MRFLPAVSKIANRSTYPCFPGQFPTATSAHQYRRHLSRQYIPSRSEISLIMSGQRYPKREEIFDIFKGVEEGDLSGFLHRTAHDVEWTVMGKPKPLLHVAGEMEVSGISQMQAMADASLNRKRYVPNE